ncbi:membrane protein [Sulfurifustis variabilis]|uniref:Membrane protein n=1 Tax=Sulfurifustis variabilis TaxID=1675686 RepID=A0A1C7AFT7_9GAMM|nr:DUF2231 domain-containing protein [Sulfurifustis variabilis]BAU50263.1 membrane protein [Sulfurifustis variabilis]
MDIRARVDRLTGPPESERASRASVAGHPIHPMLVVFPIGLWVFSLVADAVYLAGGGAAWSITAFYAIAGGIIGAIAAAVFGAIDLYSMRDRTIRRIGTMHMILNLSVTVLFAFNLGWRVSGDPGAIAPIVISVVAVVLLGVSGWLGGEMVYVHGAGVAPAAREKSPETAAPRPRS